MIIQTKDNDTVVIYQEWQNDCPGEPAIVATNNSDCVILESETGHVNINHSTIPELIKQLRKFERNIP